MSRVRIGTSGFAFPSWRGTVYPESLPRREWLHYYERVLGFEAVELNVTFYRIPGRRTMESFGRRTSERFRFAVKLPQEMTHVAAGGSWPENAGRSFREAVVPLVDSGKCAAFLAQFPEGFRPGPATWSRIGRLRDALPDVPLVCEFRHSSWSSSQAIDGCRRLGVAWAVVDLPRLPGLMPWTPAVTASPAYLRLHGRNRSWRSERSMDRYAYDYPESALFEIARTARALSMREARVMAFLNNCRDGAAVRNALRLREILAGLT